MTALRGSAAHLALMLVAVLTWACGSSDDDATGGAGGAPSAPGAGGADGEERDAGPGAGGVAQGGASGGASGGSSEAGTEGWLSACQACAEQTPACQDEECLRCIYEEPRLGNEHCDAEQQAFEIESFAILNAGCREACPSL